MPHRNARSVSAGSKAPRCDELHRGEKRQPRRPPPLTNRLLCELARRCPRRRRQPVAGLSSHQQELRALLRLRRSLMLTLLRDLRRLRRDIALPAADPRTEPRDPPRRRRLVQRLRARAHSPRAPTTTSSASDSESSPPHATQTCCSSPAQSPAACARRYSSPTTQCPNRAESPRSATAPSAATCSAPRRPRRTRRSCRPSRPPYPRLPTHTGRHRRGAPQAHRQPLRLTSGRATRSRRDQRDGQKPLDHRPARAAQGQRPPSLRASRGVPVKVLVHFRQRRHSRSRSAPTAVPPSLEPSTPPWWEGVTISPARRTEAARLQDFLEVAALNASPANRTVATCRPYARVPARAQPDAPVSCPRGCCLLIERAIGERATNYPHDRSTSGT